MTITAWPLALAAGLFLVVGSAAAAPPSPESLLIQRGGDLARSNCSACHAVGAEGASPNRRAPPFRTLAGRYVALTLHQRLTEIAETGHFDMPPVEIHSDEVEALAAYMNSLGR